MMGKRGIDMMDIARRRKEAARRLVMGWNWQWSGLVQGWKEEAVMGKD
jgi:hypothetical protein